jgi:hypothetical protein
MCGRLATDLNRENADCASNVRAKLQGLFVQYVCHTHILSNNPFFTTSPIVYALVDNLQDFDNILVATVWGIYCKIIRGRISKKNVTTWVNEAHLRITKKLHSYLAKGCTAW